MEGTREAVAGALRKSHVDELESSLLSMVVYINRERGRCGWGRGTWAAAQLVLERWDNELQIRHCAIFKQDFDKEWYARLSYCRLRQNLGVEDAVQTLVGNLYEDVDNKGQASSKRTVEELINSS
jgi:hypothetical protein